VKDPLLLARSEKAPDQIGDLNVHDDVNIFSYIISMSGLDKPKRKLASHPKSVHFGDLVHVLNDLGYREVRSRGSRHVFHPSGPGVSLFIVKPHSGHAFCAEGDVKKVIEILEEQEVGNEN
jgi:hypothetical protein